MLPNNEIIEKLTTKQKIALLTDSHEVGEEQLKQINAPSLTVTSLESEVLDQNGEPIFPSFDSLANSWDDQLFGEVTHKVACMKSAGNSLFVLPKTNSGTSVYGKGISEDPYLVGSLYAGAVNVLSNSGAPVCLQVPAVSDNDAKVMDKIADEAAIYERVVRPYDMAKRAGKCPAILVTPSDARDSYQEINKKILQYAKDEDAVLFTELDEGENTVSAINAGGQVINGSSVALEAAYDNYNRIYHSLEEGGASAHELEMAILDGAAISDEIIDNALNNKMTLADKCQNERLTYSNIEVEALAVDSARRSIVLLKNEMGALPLQRGIRVSIIGDIISSSENGRFVNFYERLRDSLLGEQVNVVGYELGYSLDRDISQEQIIPAIRLANQSDVVLLFLGHGRARENNLEATKRLALPANQVALATALKRTGKRIIAIISGSRLPEMDFDDGLHASFLIPNEGRGVANALSDVLLGKYNPSARLAYAGYGKIDARFRDTQRRKQRGEQKIGQFIGYRYTDICNQAAKYPFGHGLSYTKFSYSNLHMNTSSTLSFTVQNDGSVAGIETAQVYIGCNTSSRPRPIKELKAIYKVYLMPRQSKIITVNLNELKIYDPASERFVIDGGEYTIYVGSSASDIYLTERIRLLGPSLDSQDESITSYLQEVSNITSESYTMEAHCEPMKKTSKLKSFSLWIFALTIFADIIYGICGLLFALPFKEHLGTFAILNALSLSLAAILFIIFLIVNASLKKKQRIKEQEATKELFKNAERVEASTVEKLFVSEFDYEDEKPETSKNKLTFKGKDESIYVYMAVDTDFEALSSDMQEFFSKNGLSISLSLARATISSIVSSRLLIVRNADSQKSVEFLKSLAGFMGTSAFVESFGQRKWEIDTLLYTLNTFSNEKKPTELVNLFNYAENEKEKACFYVMTEVKYADTAEFMMPYIQYLTNPQESYAVSENGTELDFPNNMWFAIVGDDGESIEDLPAFISNLATVIDIDLEYKEKSEDAQDISDKTITTHQLEALTYRAKKASTVDEHTWKMIDSLEEFVNERTPYHIGNKIFLQLECYLAVYQATKGEISEGVDSMLASRLLPAIVAMLKGNPQMAEVDFSQTIESIFGEENVSKSIYLIKHLSIEPKKEQRPEPLKIPKPLSLDKTIGALDIEGTKKEADSFEEKETLRLDEILADKKADEAKEDEKAIEEPKTEEPKTEELKTEEPKTEEPKAEEPKIEEPKTEEPKVEDAVAKEKEGEVKDFE